MGISRGQLVDGALVLAQLMAPDVETARQFARVADDAEGDERAKVKAIVWSLNEGLQNNNWPSA